MKNMKILLISLLAAVAVFSCTFTEWDDITSLDVAPKTLKKAPRLYPGGNVACSQLGLVDLVQTTGRNDYTSSGTFVNSWPEGLLVHVYSDGSVGFQIDGSLNLGDGKCYKVGAVIVKGGDASNVYDYTDIGGAIMDRGLVAPINNGGQQAALSNLTFCFMECRESEPVVIAIKARYRAGTEGDYYLAAGTSSSASSDGEFIFTGASCKFIGINPYPGTTEIILRDYWYRSEVVGSITVTQGVNTLTVTVDLKGNGELFETRFFVGSKAQLLSTVPVGGVDDCPDHLNPLWFIDKTVGNTVSWTIPY